MATFACVGEVGVGATVTGSVAVATGAGVGGGKGVACGVEEQATSMNNVSQRAAFVMALL